jgi:hypothetical protein
MPPLRRVGVACGLTPCNVVSFSASALRSTMVSNLPSSNLSTFRTAQPTQTSTAIWRLVSPFPTNPETFLWHSDYPRIWRTTDPSPARSAATREAVMGQTKARRWLWTGTRPSSCLSLCVEQCSGPAGSGSSHALRDRNGSFASDSAHPALVRSTPDSCRAERSREPA